MFTLFLTGVSSSGIFDLLRPTTLANMYDLEIDYINFKYMIKDIINQEDNLLVEVKSK